ncbi:MAG: transketolase [Nitrososphaerales archaeon]
MQAQQEKPSQNDIQTIKEKCIEIRKLILSTLSISKSGHAGGSLSCVEILATLYFYKMKHNPLDPKWEDRDRLVLSKGHASPALFSTLCLAGYFDPKELATFRKIDSRLQGHADSTKLPFVEASTGSLGQGLSIGNGIALSARLLKKGFRTYVVMGDGELQEGQVWEAAMTSAHHRIDNLTVIIDRNGIQQSGLTESVKSLEPLEDKWKAFGWHVEAIDGHSVEELIEALDKCSDIRNKPSVIIAYTVKGKGVEFMEWSPNFHGKIPEKDQLDKAINGLDNNVS